MTYDVNKKVAKYKQQFNNHIYITHNVPECVPIVFVDGVKWDSLARL